MDKSLKKLYQSFPYIIFKGKYLIPQPPKSPSFRYFSLRAHPLVLIKRSYPHLIDQNVTRLFNENNKAELEKIFLKEHQKEVEKYKAKLQAYTKEYINPLKTIGKGLQPEIIYYRENKKLIQDLMKKAGTRHSFQVLYPHFKQLDEAEKKKYKEKAEQAIVQSVKTFNEGAAKYMIPQSTYVLPHILYLRETVNGPIKSDMLGKFKALPEEEKEKYREKSRELRNQYKKNLEAFLQKRNLNISQFQFIKEVCEKYEAQLAKKKEKKKSIQSLDE